ncbi:hypothetical protein Droror1_Dr00012576 [Drosera rotundifolia]
MDEPEPSPAIDDDTHLFKHCDQLLDSLLDSHLPQIQCFRGKWSLIATKLNNLRTRLHDLADFSPAATDTASISEDVLASVFATLTEAVSVSERCRNPSLADGKLRTQSDINSLVARLDRDLRDCDVLIRSGLLHEQQRRQVTDADSTEAAVTENREAVRIELRSVLTRLQIGASESKSAAVDSLLRLLNADDKNVLIAIEQGVVPVLARLLDSVSIEMKEKAVAAIARVSVVDSTKLIAEGLLLLNHLIRVIESGSGAAKERACVALQALSLSKENARAIGSRGGISSLLEICQAGTPSSQAVAAGVLRNLSRFEENKENFIEENAISVLIALSRSGTMVAREEAMRCLAYLVCNDDSLKMLFARQGVIESLKGYLDSSPVERSLEAAMELVRNLASYQAVGEVLISEGFIGRLVLALSCGVLGVRTAAAGAVYGLGFSSKTRKELGECGCIGPLAKMLESKAMEEREAAAMALSRLLLYAGNRKLFKKEESGVIGVVLLLDHSIQNMDKKWPVSVLASMAHSKKCRKQMVAAGVCLRLQKLVELDVDGAKKLSDSLGRGKIWGVFAKP